MQEQQNIEWKESWRDEHLKWVCGFANAQGGKIYIGRDDNGSIVRVTDKVTDKVTEKVIDRLGARHVRLLTLLTEDPGYTTTQLADKMGVTRKAVSGYLKALREMRIIERVGSDRKGYWKILSD